MFWCMVVHFMVAMFVSPQPPHQNWCMAQLPFVPAVSILTWLLQPFIFACCDVQQLLAMLKLQAQSLLLLLLVAGAQITECDCSLQRCNVIHLLAMQS
jgi:hypothetical protein